MITLEKRTRDQVLCDIDCSLLLAVGETITSVGASPICEPVTSTALTFGSAVVNTAPATYTDPYGTTTTAPIGQAFQVLIGGGSIPVGAQVQDVIVRFLLVTNRNPQVEATVRLRLNDTPA